MACRAIPSGTPLAWRADLFFALLALTLDMLCSTRSAPWPAVWSWSVCAAVLVAACAAAVVVQQARAEEIVVQLKSGRTFRAAVDARTSEQELWLRFDGQAMTIRRPIDWDRVQRAIVPSPPSSGERVRVSGSDAGEELDAAAFRAKALDLRGDAPPWEVVEKNDADTSVNGSQDPSSNFAGVSDRVTSIRADAWLDNLDADVDADGLLLQIAPVAPLGLASRLDAVSGSVEIELLTSRGRALPQRIGRWTEPLAAEQMIDGAWELRLPFQGVQPEFDLDFAPKALVKITVNLPGHGVYHATLTDVRIRPYSALRDRLQRQTGQRFLPEERSGR